MQYFSTEHVPERDRLAVLHDFVGRHVARRQFKPASNRDVRIELAAYELPGRVTLGACRYSPLVGARTRELIADGRDDYLLTIHTHDHEIVVDGAKPVLVRAGDLMVVNEATRSEFHLPDVAVSVVSLERARLTGLVPRIERHGYYHVPSAAPGLSLLRGYAGLLRQGPPGGQKARDVASRHLYELAALALDGFVAGETGRSERSIRAARLEMVKKAILDRLREPGLNVATIARSQGVSPRYVQRLFEGEGQTFSEFLRDQRLALALRLLHQTDKSQASISAIAYDCGFSDLSHFNRSFRSRYGMTPSDARADAMRNRGR